MAMAGFCDIADGSEDKFNVNYVVFVVLGIEVDCKKEPVHIGKEGILWQQKRNGEPGIS